MLLSRKFLSDYVDIDSIKTLDLAEDMTNVGNEYSSLGCLLEGTNLVVGHVLECVNHPDSDHLHVCQVDVGDGVLQIVCGAPNVRKGLKVIVSKVGSILPGGVIKKSTIRGIESNGMLCSLSELGLNSKFLTQKDIDGICELPSDCLPGDDPRKVLEMDDEYIDFDLTSNRGDLLSIMGMSYEIGAIYNKPVKSIVTDFPKTDEIVPFDLDVQTKKCPLFLLKVVRNIEIKESPNFIKNRLIASGIRPINNVVDISNYVMLETGQPLHFYDFDKVDSIVVRDAKANEEITTLDGIKRYLTEDDIVIADKKKALCLAGVMGGMDAEITNDTKNILIEAAIFDSISVRLTSKKILRSESSNRFEKGLDPKRTYMAIDRSCYLLNKYAFGMVTQNLIEYKNLDIADKEIKIKVTDINKLLGLNIQKEEVIDIFLRLGFLVNELSDTLVVTVPSRRIDISIKEDLIEEVARIYGLDKLIGKQPSLPIKKGSYDKFIRSIRDKLVDFGLNETLSYTLISSKEVYKYTNDSFEAINVLDPMSEDRKTLRYSLIPSLYAIYEYNIKRNNKDVFIFEIGKGFYKKDGSYFEDNKLAILLSGNYYNGIYNEQVNFYHLKGIIEKLFDSLGYQNRYSFIIRDLPKEFHPGSSALINLNGNDVGYIGKIHPNESKHDVFVLEINLDIIKKIPETKNRFKEISKYPNIVKDVAFIVPLEVSNEKLIAEIKKYGGKYLTDISLFDIYVGENIESNKKSMAYNLVFNDPNQTLTEDVVMPLFEKIITGVSKSLNCSIRDK